MVIATLIMVAAAALFTSIMLYWGSAYLGQSTTNLGGAIFRSNNAAAEGISIDTVLFTKIGSPTNAYTVTLYVRNFGDTPVKIAGVHFKNLQSGATTPGYDCEVTPSHMTIVARATKQIVLASNLTCSPALGTSSTLAPTWNGASISIRVNTEAGTSYQNNYSIPS